jgi:uncharacterized membrane protein YphA (DoxX/SURF4 family)
MNISPILEVGVILGRILVGLAFVVAGSLKIKAGSQWFLKTLLAYDVVHGAIAVFISKSFPWIEVICGGLLVLGAFTSSVAVAGFIILLIFTSAIASAILRDKSIDCGCFGRSTKANQARWTLVYRNFALMGLLVLVYALGAASPSVDAWLKEWIYIAKPDALVQTSLGAIWIISLSLVAVLQVSIRKRVARSSSKEAMKRSHSEA